MASKFIKHKLKNIEELKSEKELYRVYFDDANINELIVYLKCPEDSVYSCTFIKLKLDITDFPINPPKVTFVNYSDNIRIHPNLYSCGKVCLSILNTFNGPSWNPITTLHTLLVTIQTILDNQPMIHEPGRQDDPNYTSFVRYCSFNVLLLDYFKHETIDTLKEFLIENTKQNHKKILEMIESKEDCSCSGYNTRINTNYNELKNKYILLAKEQGFCS